MLYPLRFEPLFRHYLWGGRRLQTLLHKPISDGDHCAESWEIVDHGQDQSRVAWGELAGSTLHEIVRHHGGELLGRHAPKKQFPLLLKFLDAQHDLSVQVHPNDAQAARLQPPDLGKTEAWVVLHADPGSLIYAGLKRGFDRAALEREIARGTTELCLHRFHPQPGDCVFIPAGTIHALGAGLVVAEIQQASDTTFRLFDWNRVDGEGRPRQLHIEAGLDVIDFERGPVDAVPPQDTAVTGLELLVACPQFTLKRWTTGGPIRLTGDSACHILTVLQGAVDVAGDPSGRPLGLGQTVLLPAACGAVDIIPREPAVLLQAHLP